MADDADKKHDPSEKKWEDAAKEGQLPKSADAASAAIVLAGAATVTYGAQVIARGVQRVTTFSFDVRGVTDLDASGAADRYLLLNDAIGSRRFRSNFSAFDASFARLCARPVPRPTSAITASGSAMASSDPHTATMASSAAPAVELGKALLKLIAVGAVIGAVLWREAQQVPILATVSPVVALQWAGALCWKLVLYATPLLLVIAAVDYGYAYYRTFQQLKRTDQEVKDEGKEQGGDPQMRGKRRQRAREIALGGRRQRLAEADVVITNPTHYAVALRYTPGVDPAPIVVAKGVDDKALEIRREAFKLGIPRVEDRPLARRLFADVKLGDVVPEDLYVPVAAVLRVVFARRGTLRKL